MPKGFKCDITLTALAHSGMYGELLRDKRSFWSLPKMAGHTNGEAVPHLIAYGKDKGPIRAQIFKINREACGVNRCSVCDVMVEEHDGDHIAATGEWDHIDNGPGLRCDCIGNGRVSCRNCHSERHVKPRFGHAGA